VSKLRCFFNCYQLAYATLFFLSTKEEEFYKMSKLFNLLGVGVTFLFLSGCASNSGEYPSARTPSTAPSSQSGALKCNAGELLVCESRSPHRISDGRYGRKNNKGKKCSCQPETDLSDFNNNVLGQGQ
jgi:hypothetical protein